VAGIGDETVKLNGLGLILPPVADGCFDRFDIGFDGF
jgi:hypothetical protein